MALSLNTATLALNLGAMFRPHTPIMLNEIFVGNPSFKHLNIVQCKDELPLIATTQSSIVRPSIGDNSFAPTLNATGFTTRILKSRWCKVDLEYMPHELDTLYMGFLARAGRSTPRPMAFEKEILALITEKMKEDIELNAVFLGTYNAAGTTPGATMTGFLNLIPTLGTTPIVTGAITNTNARDSFELVYKSAMAAKPQLRGKKVKLYCSYASYEKYCEDYRAEFGALPYNTQYEHGTLQASGGLCEIVPLVAMGTSQRLIVTTPDNLYLGADLLGEASTFRVVEWLRSIRILGDFAMGVQIGRTDIFFHNEQL
jgi:hypothetical protein